VIAVCLAVMVVLVFGNVVLRYAFNSGLTHSQKVSRLVVCVDDILRRYRGHEGWGAFGV
jgi:hypothetical protein